MKQEIIDALALIYDEIGNAVEELNDEMSSKYLISIELINMLRETANDIELILLNHGFNTIDNSLNI